MLTYRTIVCVYIYIYIYIYIYTCDVSRYWMRSCWAADLWLGSHADHPKSSKTHCIPNDWFALQPIATAPRSDRSGTERTCSGLLLADFVSIITITVLTSPYVIPAMGNSISERQPSSFSPAAISKRMAFLGQAAGSNFQQSQVTKHRIHMQDSLLYFLSVSCKITITEGIDHIFHGPPSTLKVKGPQAFPLHPSGSTLCVSATVCRAEGVYLKRWVAVGGFSSNHCVWSTHKVC